MNNIFKNVFKTVIIAASVIIAPSAYADDIKATPIGWRMQDYLDGRVVLYYTGSSCNSGEIDLSSTASDGSKSRLWSLIMSAKLAHVPVQIYYHNSGGSCTIDSFVLVEN